MVYGHIEVGDGLSLHSLGSVHHQKGTFAAGYASGDFVGEIDMTRSIDEVELVLLAAALVHHLNRVAFDCDALLLLEVHIVKDLVFHISLRERTGKLEKPVGQRALAVVDVGYYAEITYVLHSGTKIHNFGENYCHTPLFLLNLRRFSGRES